MVQNHHHRGGGSYYKRTSSSTANFFSKKPSFLSITLYIILLFAFSIFIFLVKTSINILDVDNGTDGQRTVFTEHFQSQSQSQSELESLEVKIGFFFIRFLNYLLMLNYWFLCCFLHLGSYGLACESWFLIRLFCFLGGFCVLVSGLLASSFSCWLGEVFCWRNLDLLH